MLEELHYSDESLVRLLCQRSEPCEHSWPKKLLFGLLPLRNSYTGTPGGCKNPKSGTKARTFCHKMNNKKKLIFVPATTIEKSCLKYSCDTLFSVHPVVYI